jgi:ABC-type multidrug transport system fused ATPase/permease subunit
MVAIAGANGSGKSSVLKLINGMYPQVAGSIRLDGLDIRQLDALSLRRGISYIPQSESIFSGTVRENLSLGAPFATDSDMLRALEQADAMEDVLNLPRGLDTVMGAQGVQVPQVLAFKLALARSYVNLKPLILCDELPYALLSTPAGELFRAQLQRLKGKFTIILVAHTSDLVRMADQAVFLQANHRPVVGRPADILPRMLEQSYGIFG